MKIKDCINNNGRIPVTGIPVESLEAAEAYEYYYTLGDKDRSISKVMEHFGYSQHRVECWSVWYNWRARTVARNYEIAERLRRKTNNEIIKDKIEYRKIIKALLVSFVNEVKAGKIKCKSIKDFVNLVSLDLNIQGSLSDDFNLQKLEYLEAKVDEQGNKIDNVSNETLDTLTRLLDELKVDGGDSGEVAEAVKPKG